MPVARIIHAPRIQVIPIDGFRPVVFRHTLQQPVPGQLRPQCHLSEGIALPEVLAVQVSIESYHSRQLPVIVIVISLCPDKCRCRGLPGHVHLPVTLVHAAVRPPFLRHQRDIPQRVWIVILRIRIFPLHRERQPAAYTLFIAHERTCQSERTQLHLSRHVSTAIPRRQSQRLYRERRRRACLLGRNEDIVIVTHRQRQLTHVVQRVARDVYLPTLTVAQHHPVVGHPRMTGPEATYRYRLHAAGTPVVPQRDARDSVERIRHVRHPESQELLPFQQVVGRRASGYLLPPLLRHRHPLQPMRPVRHRIVADYLRICRRRPRSA